jgi:type IV pilus secretin PilQ/predicted competence protein
MVGGMIAVVLMVSALPALIPMRSAQADTAGVAAVEAPAQVVMPQPVPASAPVTEAPAQVVPPQAPAPASAPAVEPVAQVEATATVQGEQTTMSDRVTINIDDGMIVQVLNAFSRQTGRSIVVGPEVTGKVTARLSNVAWRDALDAILRPYGYGYYLAGDTIIVISLDKLPKTVPAVGTAPVVPPKIVKVFTLKYLDAADIADLIKGQLSPNGTVGRLVMQSQSWDEGASGGTQPGTSSESLGRLKRFSEKSDQVKGKTFVVVDTAEVIQRVGDILAQVDTMPDQIQIEAKFVEVSANRLRDIGFEWGTGPNGTTPGVSKIGTTEGGNLYGVGAQQVSGSVKPAGFVAQSAGLNGTQPYNSGMTLAFQKLTGVQFEMLLHLLEEDSSFKVLSSPRVLTMNNQDAVIIVGTKLPIIKSTTDSNSGGVPTISTSLERYEDIGIKLKVLPQICEDNYINLIVHPSVRDLLSYQSGKVSSGTQGGNVSLTDYPVVATREAETQVMVKSGQTIVIGGMVRERKQTSQLKVPFLGSIPLLGLLFRRETIANEQVELVIFLTARIRNSAEEDVVEPTKLGPKGSALLEPSAAKATAKQGGLLWGRGNR